MRKNISRFELPDFVKNLLNDPVSVYNHVNSLKSTKAKKKFLGKQQRDVIDSLNKLPDQIERLKYQHEHNYLSTVSFEEKMEKIEKLETELKRDLSGIAHQIADRAISDIYIETIEMFSAQYKAFLEGKVDDVRELSNLIHLIVDRIHIYSRKATTEDVIAGRKKDDQQIPNKIRIDLQLPQDMLLRFAQEGKFEVRNRELWTIRDSNP